MLTSKEYYELINIDPDFSELVKLESKINFWDFCLYMDYDFFLKREKIIMPIAKNMQNLLYPLRKDKEIDIYNVSLPPRTGKSYLTTLFCSWVFGKNKSASIMRNTVTESLYNKFSKDLISIISGGSHKGRYLDVFDVEMLSRSVGGWAIEGNKQGISYFGSGVGGSIIGFGADTLSIVDDSVKNEEEAMNEVQLEKKFGWYGSTMDSREEAGCKKLFIGTRWSKRDIVGRLEELGLFKGVKAKNTVVPALKNGKSYCENIHSTKKLLEKKLITSKAIWNAEWMQEPIEVEGLVFPEKELKFFDIKKLNKNPDGKVFVCDTADEGTDFLCAIIAYIYGENIYIVDVVFTDKPIESTEPMVASMIDRYNPDKIRFESNNGGKSFARNIKNLLKKCKTPVKWKPTTKNKHTRIIMKSSIIKEYFNFFQPKQGTMYYNYIKNLCKYNYAGTVKHDDAPDATTMVAELLEKQKWGW